MTEYERGEVRRFGWGPDQRLSDKDENALREDDTGWRRRLSVTFCIDTRNGRSTQRCSLGHDRRPRNLTSKPEKRPTTPSQQPCARWGCKKNFEVISMRIHTRKKFSRSGIQRRTVISSSCTKYEAKEAKKIKDETTHL